MNTIISLLSHIWLHQSESKVMSQLIFASWSLSATQVAKLCQISRLSAHSTLSQLVSKWLASQTQYNKTYLYASISINQIKERVNNTYAGKMKAIEELSTLKEKYKYQRGGDKLWTHTLTGVEWLKSVYEETLKSDYIFWMISSNKTMDQKFLDYLYDHYIERRNAIVKNIKTIFMPFSYKRFIKQCRLRKLEIKEQIGVLFDSKTYIENTILLWWNEKVTIVSVYEWWIKVTTHSDQIFHDTMLNVFNILRERTKKI